MNRCEELLWAWEDGALNREELAELEALMEVPEGRELLAESFLLRSAVYELRAQEKAAVWAAPAGHPARGVRERMLVPAFWALAACLVLAVGAWVLIPRPVGVATLAWKGGEGRVEGAHRWPWITDLRMLRAGDDIRMPVGVQAEIAYTDGTRLSVRGPAGLILQGSAEAKCLHLHEGFVLAKVARQSAEHPMVLTTAAAEITVIGTTFELEIGESSTLVRMQEGTTRVRRLADDGILTLRAGEEASVTESPSDHFETQAPGRLLFREDFEDGNFASRGWYEDTELRVSDREHVRGSEHSLEFRFLKGASTPVSGGRSRIRFPETEALRLSYWIKYSSTWVGSGKAYGPNEVVLMTNQNSDWDRISYSRLSVFIEQNKGVPRVILQDAQNINAAHLGQDLSDITEDRSIAGGNGSSDGYEEGGYYRFGNEWRNAKQWSAPLATFQDGPGPHDKTQWHRVEVKIRLNSIIHGKAVADGHIQYRYDGELVMDYPGVIFRTAANSGMKFNQLLLVPYMEEGSPVEQSFWIDNLVLEEDVSLQDPTPKQQNPKGK